MSVYDMSAKPWTVDRNSTEYDELANYLMNSRGHSHGIHYNVSFERSVEERTLDILTK